MSVINLNSQVSLQEAEDAICAFGNQNPVHLVGEPGVGKTAMHDRICKRLGLRGVYMDVPNIELGDIGIPMPNHETKTTALYPNEAWGIHTGEPLVFFLDEFTKGSEAVKNTLHPLLNERRLANFKLHPDSIVVTAGNNSTDGVGDVMKSHSLNRITVMAVRKPTSDEWREWGMNNEVAPEVLAWVNRFPHAMASYTDAGQGDNPYIFNPKKPQVAFVSPRSLATASNIVSTRKQNDSDSVIAALSGAIGEAAARDMQAYIEFSDQLPSWEDTIKDPKHTKVPTSPGACAIVIFGAIARIDKTNIAPFMEYLERFDAEWQAVFAINIAKTPSKQSIAFGNRDFSKWVADNQDLL